MKLTALSIVAPSGLRIARGEKTLEVRSWRPDCLPLRKLLIVENDRFLRQEGDIDPHGRAVAMVEVLDVRPWREDDLVAACATAWSTGYWAWCLGAVRPLHGGICVPAARKLYEVEADAALQADIARYAPGSV